MTLLILASMTLAGANASVFAPPFRVQAEEGYINVAQCHAAPVYEDIDGDGVKELLVGQFGEGRIRLYRNHGTNERPVFKEHMLLQAGGKEIEISCG